ncbi:carbon-nitrogen hydrolase family protein [Palleronia sediminis]|uniref:Carbon-nitrogen hydrolase family protein n=1 Tax=Palleronia sediminis TaxID=2547833 RepID=A0A4R6A650_9RHOB|nr:carbon-nitrogen hydrolase family protein [Palleronia sediminis]TDL78167.1 carbon-nitrogen hydrolase family protein [Palleronia sediminis]
MTRVALVQLCATDDPGRNAELLRDAAGAAVAGGARLIATPEVTNCISGSRSHQSAVLRPEDEDIVVAEARALAARHGVEILLGSVAVTTGDADGRFANRSILIDDRGGIVARYDKIHMFDVEIDATETYRESSAYRPGERAVLAPSVAGLLGMTICYDLRFPHLYRALAQAGAMVLSVPAAFSPVTGASHWEVLLRARAIETGCYVIAPAQCGTHPTTRGRVRRSYGHSLAVAPWGEVIARMGDAPGIAFAEIDLEAVADARRRVPSLAGDRRFSPPEGLS